MSENYDAKLCEARHERINERLDNHEERLDKLEQDSVGLQKDLKNLCENLKSLTTTIRWFIGLLVGFFTAFFFYAVQNHIFE